MALADGPGILFHSRLSWVCGGGLDLGSDPVLSLHLYWPCFYSQLNSEDCLIKSPGLDESEFECYSPPCFSSSSLVLHTTNVQQGGGALCDCQSSLIG